MQRQVVKQTGQGIFFSETNFSVPYQSWFWFSYHLKEIHGRGGRRVVLKRYIQIRFLEKLRCQIYLCSEGRKAMLWIVQNLVIMSPGEETGKAKSAQPQSWISILQH